MGKGGAGNRADFRCNCRYIALSVLPLVCATCAKRPAPSQPLAVEFAGCAAVKRGPICTLGKGRGLRLWVPGKTAGEVQARADGAGVALAEKERLQGGTAFEIMVPEGVHAVQVSSGPASWRLSIEEISQDPVLARAEALRTSGKLDEAERELQAGRSRIPPALQDRADALLARIALTRGQVEVATKGLRQSARQARDEGRVSDAVRDLGALLYIQLRDNTDPAAARETLAEARTMLDAYPEGRGTVRYYEGAMAASSSDVREALAAFRETIEVSRRLGNGERRRIAQQELAKILASLGRTGEAIELQRAVLAGVTPEARDPPCNRAGYHVTLSWLALRDRPLPGVGAGGHPTVDVLSLLGNARRALEQCPDPFGRRHALVNEGLFALERRDLAGARARLADLQKVNKGQSGELAVWEKEIEARLALAEGHPQAALELFREQDLLARASGFAEGRLHASVGSGRALVALRRPAEALVAFQAAEATLGELLDGVPLAEGRNEFLGLHDDGIRHLVSTLVELGRRDEAFRAARQARARALRGAALAESLHDLGPADRERFEQALARYRRERAALEAEAAEDWRRPLTERNRVLEERALRQRKLRDVLDEAFRTATARTRSAQTVLRTPATGELHLLYFPGAEGWFAFAASPGSLVVKPLPPIDLAASPQILADTLLEPFRREVGRANRIHFLPTGPLQAVDFHSLPWDGLPLIDSRIVSYGLDISSVRAPSRPAGSALVVSNGTGDLGAASQESVKVAAALAQFSPLRLDGPAATRARVLASLPEAAIFHFAGHGGFAGVEGFDSALLLADGGRLSLGDVLALPRVPPLVVLAACEAARSVAASGTEGLGLAQAFLAAGAEAVVAPTRRLADQGAGQLFSAFYGEYFGASQLDPAKSLSRVQRTLRRDFPAVDWSSVRVLSP
jgi:tetratricopeptide (TPR) repeat protein